MQYCVYRFLPPGSLAAKVLDILVRVPCIIHSPPGFLLSIFNQRRNRDLQNHHFYNEYKVTISIQSNKRAVFVHILHWFQQQWSRYSFLNMVFIVNSKEFYFVTWIHSMSESLQDNLRCWYKESYENAESSTKLLEFGSCIG